MAPATIKIDTAVRDPLATLAAERGLSIGGLAAEFGRKTPTVAERTKSRAETIAYIREHFNPDFGGSDRTHGPLIPPPHRAG